MFANCQLMGLDLAFPDICKTPPALIPIPYPNFALGPMAIPNAWNILLMGMPAHNMATVIPITNGDNPGLALGLISPSVMGPSRHITCVPNTLFKAIPATRLTSMTVQNRANTVGARIVPSQVKVVLLGSGGSGGGAGSRAAGGAAKGGKGGSRGASQARGARGGSNAKTASGKGGGGSGRGAGNTGGRGRGGSGGGGKGGGGKGGGGKGGKPRRKSNREQNVGRTPGKNSRTGREVQDRMRKNGKLREDPNTGETQFYSEARKKWYPLRDADMAHTPTDVVTWWNRTGYKFGRKAPEVRKWMLDSKNYTLEHFNPNRAAGARSPEIYRLPAK